MIRCLADFFQRTLFHRTEFHSVLILLGLTTYDLFSLHETRPLKNTTDCLVLCFMCFKMIEIITAFLSIEIRRCY